MKTNTELASGSMAALLAVAFLVSAVAQTPAPPANLDWPLYGNDVGGMRYVNLDQINASNAANLAPAWIFHTGVFSENTSFEAQPIVVGGVLYVSSAHDHVFALDAATGALKWTYNPEMPPLSELAISSSQGNRGVAVGNGKVFIGQFDANLVALDANTGRVVWKVAVDRWQDNWTETMAPLFVDGKVIIGASGGEFLRRGHVSAYDADTGRMLWRFYTVPGPGEFGNDTWAGDSWKTGGATVWSTPSADTQLGLLYISTGNAAPDENGSQRAGDNLFATSVVALDLNTGKYRWHFQEVHHDLWDYDAVQPAHLFTLERNGQQIPALGHANKNGNYFILDRRNGKPLFDVKEVPVPTEPAWQHPSPTQPMPATDPLIPQSVSATPPGMRSGPMWTVPQEQPILIQPGFEAGPEWTGSAYSPRTKFAYIQAGGYEPWLYHAIPPIVNSLGSTGTDEVPGVQNYGLFDAVDTTTGKIAWSIRTPEKIVSGAVVAGDVVFFGESNGKFNGVDSKTGRSLWSFKSDQKGVGGANGSPAVYMVNGREYVVMTLGGNNPVRSNGQPSPPGDAVIAFALPQPGPTQPNMVTASPRPVDTGAVPETAMRAPLQSPPPDAQVVELTTHDFDFHPNNFTVLAGQKLAVHIVNTGEPPAGFAIKLPSGPTALKGPVKSKEDAYFAFTAPEQPGVYEFFSPIGPQKFFGMKGFMRVAPACSTPSTPCISSAGVVGAASLLPGAVSPGEVVSIFGAGIGPTEGVRLMLNSSGQLNNTLAGTRVLFDGIPAPLLFVQANQINAVVPYGLAGKTTAELEIERNGARTPLATVSVVDVAPSIFTLTGSGKGQGAILNQDKSLNAASNPASKGSVISLFATGEGQTDPPGVDGNVSMQSLPQPQRPVSVLIGGMNAEVISARVAPDFFSGVLQVDVRVPDAVASDAALPIRLVVGDVISSPGATIAVR